MPADLLVFCRTCHTSTAKLPEEHCWRVHVLEGGGGREEGNQPGNEEPKQVADGGCRLLIFS